MLDPLKGNDMKTFDYVAAWNEAAYPAFLKLSPAAVNVLEVVKAEAKDRHQNSALDMDWTPEIRAAFEAMTDSELATSSRAVYFAGHWHPGKANSHVPRDGSTWKFSLFCDQLLSERLGLVRNRTGSTGNGTSYAIHQGALRVQWSTPDSWQWEEIGYASAELFKALQESETRPVINAKHHSRREWDEWADRMTAWADSVKTTTTPLFDAERFMVSDLPPAAQA